MADQGSDHRLSEDQSAATRETRFDAAHPMIRADDTDPVSSRPSKLVAAQLGATNDESLASTEHGKVSEEADGDLSPKRLASPHVLTQHAEELADRLQERLVAIDRREARLNSQEAEFDGRIRNARLWIDEREAELADRERQIAEKEQQYEHRQAAAEESFARGEELQSRLAELDQREHAIAALEVDLEVGLKEQQTRTAALEVQTASFRSREEELQAAIEDYETRHRDLDQREAELYKSQERLAGDRLEIDKQEQCRAQREEQLAETEARLEQVERQLAQRASETEFLTAEVKRKADAVDRRSGELEAAQRGLEARQREIGLALERLERLGIVEEKMVQLEQQAVEFSMRTTYLDNAEAILAEQHVKHTELDRQLQRQRIAFENEIAGQRRDLADESDRMRTEIEQKARQLDRREAELDQRKTALEELAEQLAATQRETLEMRLATEETWLQLQGAIAPASLSRSIAQTRQRLSDHFRLAASEVNARRKELEEVRSDLAGQLAEIDHRREEVDRWIEIRQEDLERQAARLVARERELDQQHRHFESEQQSWQTERGEYQRQIQQLLSELRHEANAAA